MLSQQVSQHKTDAKNQCELVGSGSGGAEKSEEEYF
jgi:hypothetical protein